MRRGATSASIADAIRPERLRRWVIAVGVSAIVASVASDAYNQWRSYRSTLADNSRELVNVARILAAQTNATLEAVDLLLRGVVRGYAERREAHGADLDVVLSARAEGLPQLLSLAIIDARGNEIFRSRKGADEAYPSVADRSYFVAHRDNPNLGLFVSEPIVTRTGHHPAVVLSRRLNDAHERFAGVVAGVIDLDAFQRFYRQIKLGERSAILLMRDDGMLLVREPPLPDRIGMTFPTLAQTLSTSTSMRMVSPVDRARRVIAGARADGFPLGVAIAREESAVLDRWYDELYVVAVQDIGLSLLIALAVAALVHQLRRVEQGERALRESERRYARAMEGANEGHFEWTPHGSSFLSPTMKELLGLAPDAPIAAQPDALVNVHPDDRTVVDAAFDDLMAGRTDRYDVEYRVRRTDGQWHWVQARGRSMPDEDGDGRRLVGSAIDVSERKRAEEDKDRLESQLRKSQKMEAMGTLAGGIAHDFNNILGAIVGYGEMAQRSAAQGSVVRRYVDNVMQAAGRAKALVEGILAFSRSGVGERVAINVQAVIAETLDLLAPSLPGRVELRRRLDAGDAAVIGDATQLHQVAMNLCTNAVQAMPAGGVLEVRLDRVETSEPRAVFQAELPPGRYVRLAVSDTGVGIRPEVLERIFDPFFTTKRVGGGTGLGLSLVHGIIADVGGAVDVTSVIDEGTTFTIWLPVAGTAAASKPEIPTDAPRGSGQVVMVVDDERTLVALAEEMLAELGYEPVGFDASAEALAAFAEEPRRFDAVITDEMMPDKSGTDLAREFRRIRSDIPIVVMSGYVDAAASSLARSAGANEVLRKPLRSRDIAEALARALHAAPAANPQ